MTLPAVYLPELEMRYMPRMEVLPTRRYWRVPHDIERVNMSARAGVVDYRYRGNDFGVVRDVVTDKGTRPEVYRMFPFHHTVLSCAWLWTWRKMNPELSDKKWATLLGDAFALTNDSGSLDHYNCVTGENPGKPEPRFDEPRIMGGAIVTGTTESTRLWLETSKVNQWRDAEYILARPWLWFYATSVNRKGEVNYITRLGLDGLMHRVKVPLMTTIAVYLPLADLAPVPEGEWPEATWMR